MCSFMYLISLRTSFVTEYKTGFAFKSPKSGKQSKRWFFWCYKSISRFLPAKETWFKLKHVPNISIKKFYGDKNRFLSSKTGFLTKKLNIFFIYGSSTNSAENASGFVVKAFLKRFLIYYEPRNPNPKVSQKSFPPSSFFCPPKVAPFSGSVKNVTLLLLMIEEWKWF